MIRRNLPPQQRGWKPADEFVDFPDDDRYGLDHTAQRARRAWAYKDAERRRKTRHHRREDLDWEH